MPLDLATGSMRAAPLSEEWRPVDDWPHYEVSNTGRVRRVSGRVLKLSVNDKGYWQAHLRDSGRERNAPVHRLVALAFIGPPPSPQHEVAHEDGDGRNARVDNLSWKLHVENEADKRRHGTHRVGAKHHSSRLSSDAITAVKELHAAGFSYSRIAALVGCSSRHVGKIINHQRRAFG